MTSVLHVCSEVYPLLKTGGLADVAAALPPALIRLGHDARILVPAYPSVRAGVVGLRHVTSVAPRFGADAIDLYLGAMPDSGAPVYLIDAPTLYDRSGDPYSNADRQPYADNCQRFALLGWMAAQLALGLDAGWKPQVIHGHDWHAGLAPAYLHAARIATSQPLAASVFTVHNLAYQGLFAREAFNGLDLPPEFFAVDGAEFHSQLSFLKAGLFYADKISTVSPSYAREILDADQGCGLEGLLRSRSAAGDLAGILNGVDPAVWSPASDPFITSFYSTRAMAGKLLNKVALQREHGLAEQDDKPLFCVVSRMTEQKGLKLVLTGIAELIQRGGQLMVLGSGDAAMEAEFLAAAARHPQSVAVQIGYDEEKSHRIIAGSDVVMVPSRFEPCGLTQLYGLRYGSLPLVRRIGGLGDSVTDCALENIADGVASGFVFDEFNESAFLAALRRAFALFARKRDWNLVQKYAMKQEFSWESAARHYLALYDQALKMVLRH
ncbi:MAG: glycogen synthase GlgA [Janthinobacterium lividum]